MLPNCYGSVIFQFIAGKGFSSLKAHKDRLPGQAVYRKTVLVAESLKEAINSGQFPSNSKLPAVRSLCRRFGASPWTILNAVSQLEKDGMLQRRPRSGIYAMGGIPSPAPVPEDSRQSKSKPDSIAVSLGDDIQNGKYRTGERLPSKKFLQFQYGASPATLDKALRLIEDNGLVHRVGASWCVGIKDALLERSSNAIQFAGDRACFGQQRYMQGNWRLFCSLESEMNRSRIRMMNRVGVSSRAVLRESLGTEMGALLGRVFVVVPKSLPALGHHLRRNVQRRKPSPHGPIRNLVVCNSPDMRNPDVFSFPRSHNVFGFAPDDFKAGETIASHLASKGHRNVGFFTGSNEKWDRQRLCGVEQGMQKALGNKGTVVGFSANKRPSGFSEFLPLDTPKNRKAIDKVVSRLFGGYRFEQMEPYFRIAQDLLGLATEDQQTLEARNLFREAMANKRISAWIGSDPIITLMAYDFLIKNNVAIPREVSLVAIDDNNELLATRRITAYRFQFETMGYLAARAIMRDIPIKRDRHSVVECPGRIVERGSVGRVKRGASEPGARDQTLAPGP